jgi:hypothetical protein
MRVAREWKSIETKTQAAADLTLSDLTIEAVVSCYKNILVKAEYALEAQADIEPDVELPFDPIEKVALRGSAVIGTLTTLVAHEPLRVLQEAERLKQELSELCRRASEALAKKQQAVA